MTKIFPYFRTSKVGTNFLKHKIPLKSLSLFDIIYGLDVTMFDITFHLLITGQETEEASETVHHYGCQRVAKEHCPLLHRPKHLPNRFVAKPSF